MHERLCPGRGREHLFQPPAAAECRDLRQRRVLDNRAARIGERQAAVALPGAACRGFDPHGTVKQGHPVLGQPHRDEFARLVEAEAPLPQRLGRLGPHVAQRRHGDRGCGLGHHPRQVEIVRHRDGQIGHPPEAARRNRRLAQPGGQPRLAGKGGVGVVGLEDRVIGPADAPAAELHLDEAVQPCALRRRHPDIGRRKRDRHDPQRFQTEQLARIRDRIAVEVAPHPQLGPHRIGRVDDPVTVRVQSRKVGDGRPAGAAEHLGDVVDPPVPVQVAHQETVIAVKPAGLLRETVAVEVEPHPGVLHRHRLDPVAVEVDDQRVDPVVPLQSLGDPVQRPGHREQFVDQRQKAADQAETGQRDDRQQGIERVRALEDHPEIALERLVEQLLPEEDPGRLEVLDPHGAGSASVLRGGRQRQQVRDVEIVAQLDVGDERHEVVEVERAVPRRQSGPRQKRAEAQRKVVVSPHQRIAEEAQLIVLARVHQRGVRPPPDVVRVRRGCQRRAVRADTVAGVAVDLRAGRLDEDPVAAHAAHELAAHAVLRQHVVVARSAIGHDTTRAQRKQQVVACIAIHLAVAGVMQDVVAFAAPYGGAVAPPDAVKAGPAHDLGRIAFALVVGHEGQDGNAADAHRMRPDLGRQFLDPVAVEDLVGQLVEERLGGLAGLDGQLLQILGQFLEQLDTVGQGVIDAIDRPTGTHDRAGGRAEQRNRHGRRDGHHDRAHHHRPAVLLHHGFEVGPVVGPQALLDRLVRDVQELDDVADRAAAGQPGGDPLDAGPDGVLRLGLEAGQVQRPGIGVVAHDLHQPLHQREVLLADLRLGHRRLEGSAVTLGPRVGVVVGPPVDEGFGIIEVLDAGGCDLALAQRTRAVLERLIADHAGGVERIGQLPHHLGAHGAVSVAVLVDGRRDEGRVDQRLDVCILRMVGGKGVAIGGDVQVGRVEIVGR